MTVWVLLPALGIEGEANFPQVLARLSLLYRPHGPARECSVIEAIYYEAGTSQYLHHVPTEACVCGHRPLEIDLGADLQIAFPNNINVSYVG